MSAAGSAKAEATGSLAATPLPDMLVSLLDRGLSGSLVLQDPKGRKCALTVAAGCVVKVRTPEPVVRLGDLLIELHAVDPPGLERGLRLAKQADVPLGQALLRLGAVAQPILDAGLTEQLARRVVWIAGLAPETRFGFYGGTDFLSGWGAGAVENDPLALIWRTAQGHANQARVDSVMERIGDRTAKLHPRARIDRFHLGWEETTVIERVRVESLLLRELLEVPGIESGLLARVLYVLALTRHLDLGDGRDPVGVGAATSAVQIVPLPPPVALAPASTGVPSITPSVVAPPPSSSASGGGAFNPRGLGLSLRPGVPPPPPPRTAPGHPPPPPPPPQDANAASLSTAQQTTPEPASVSVTPPVVRSATHTTSRRTATAPAEGAPPVTSLRPGAIRPDPLEWRLNAKLAQCERRDLYGLLEIEHSAPTTLVQAAYVKLAKVWHPDKLPPAMGHRREDATRLFAKLTEARRVLSDAAERARYDRELVAGESEVATVERVVEAAAEFRKAELLARRNDFSAAIPHAEAAYKNDDEQPEYAALFAYVVVQSGASLEPKRLEALVKLVDEAATRDAENVRVRLYRAFVLKRAGRIDEAQKDFRFVARNDRHNVDAMREIRLHNLRKEKDKQQGGFLGGLFGRPSTTPKSRR